jgi:urocanate hydratase
MKHTDFMKIAGERWNLLTDKEKEPYNKLAEADKKRYEKQMKEWEDKGYYTLEDGTKSSKFAKKSGAGEDSESEKEIVKPKKKSSKAKKPKK